MSTSNTIEKREWSDIPWSVRWRAHLVRLPRSVPRPILRITSPEGPYPFVVDVPSRYADHKIRTWVFLPPENKLAQHKHNVPIHLDFHGGGFIMGGPFEQAPFCAKLARERGCIVITVDYCMGPLYQFPLALENAEDILQAVMDSDQKTEAGQVLYSAISSRHIPRRQNHRETTSKTAHEQLRADPLKLSLSGFSSGGNICLNLVSNITDDDGHKYPSAIPSNIPPFPVILFYPQFDQTHDSHNRPAPPNVLRPGKFGTSLETKLVPTYMPSHLRSHPRASPSLVPPPSLHRGAQFFLVLPENDTLTSIANEWIDRLRSSGMGDRLKVFRAPGMSHGWANFPERMLKTTPFRLKMEAYDEMMQFFEQVDSGLRVREEKRDVTGEVSTEGYDGLGTTGV